MGLLDNIVGAMGNLTGGQAQSSATPTGGAGGLAALLPVVLGMLAGKESGGGGLGGALGSMLGGQQGGGGGLGGSLGSVLGGQSGGAGGLGALLEKFQQAGLGEQVQSWVGTGQNLPISPDVIGKVFGEDAVANIAKQSGMSEDETASGLSQLLPEVVDKLTPGGQMPDFAQLTASLGSLKQKFGL